MKRQRIRKGLLALIFLLFQYRLFHLFFSPVLVVIAAARGVANASLIIYAGLFLASLFFGRAWCGWLCPGTAINEACSLLVRRRARPGKADWIKYAVFGVWAGVIGFLAIQAGGLHSINLFFGMERRSLTQDLLLMFGAVAIIVPFALLFGRFGNCHYLCWQAPIMVLGTKIRDWAGWPGLRMEAKPKACLDCGRCDRHCPMGLPVAAMVQRGSLRHAECILCGNCADHCPAGAVRFAFRAPGEGIRRSSGRMCRARLTAAVEEVRKGQLP